MAIKNVPKKLVNATETIANVADLILNDIGHNEWEVEAIHLSSKNPLTNEKIECKWVLINGEYELLCERVQP